MVVCSLVIIAVGRVKAQPSFEEYVKSRQYFLLSPAQYAEVLKSAGFSNIQFIDQTQYFIEILRTELERFEKEKDSFLAEFDEKDFNDIVQGWKVKIERCTAGHQKWATFYAEK
eukprot:TRINITY_DN762_c0_g2_i2.p1 TRINITY_DN762_c0_g2~~TRINITY_DN762_c0_g2_i2.p1  ORF type:complete len:114 (-),score=33.53 TRINITY_DN762_c0_g2_i2:40-381(-)